MITALDTVKTPINRAGWPFIAIAVLLTIGLFLLWEPLGWIGVILTAWCVYFFRDPHRVTPIRDGLILSAADGTVLPVVETIPPPDLELGDAPRPRVSVFLNVFDVHVNRIPCDCRVLTRAYRPGKFFNAALDKASEDNERMCLRLRLDRAPDGPQGEIGLVQIAGLVARRIRCDAGHGQSFLAGQRFGLIRFGSRVDIYLPPGATPLVIEGQRAIAGETVIADLQSGEPPRRGVSR